MAHSDEIKAEVVAALLSGLGVSEVAKQYKLPRQTVSRFKNELAPEVLGQIGTEKRIRIDDLLLDSLAANLIAQKKIAETVSEPDYIRGQAASSIAELFSAFADKAVRLLEAASMGEGTGTDTASG